MPSVDLALSLFILLSKYRHMFVRNFFNFIVGYMIGATPTFQEWETWRNSVEAPQSCHTPKVRTTGQ